MQLERFKPTNEVGRNLSLQCQVQEFTSQEAIKHFMMLDSTVYLSDIWKQEKIGNYYLKYCKRSPDMQLERFKPTNKVGRNLSPQCSVQEFTSQEAFKHFMMLDK